MEQLLLKAATTVVDQGAFAAIAAAYSVDRVKDQIVPGAFTSTIATWRASGKRIPLHWNHEGDPRSIIGSIDPQTMAETDQGLYVEGQVDIKDSEIAREAWRSMKNGSMSLSFGYLATKAKKGKDGVQELHEIDLFEVSIVPAPANADTRVLTTKAAEDTSGLTQQLQETKALLAKATEELEALRKAEVTDKESVARSVDPLRKQAEAVALEFASGGRSLRKPPRTVPPRRQDPELSLDDLKRRMRDEILIHLSGGITP